MVFFPQHASQRLYKYSNVAIAIQIIEIHNIALSFPSRRYCHLLQYYILYCILISYWLHSNRMASRGYFFVVLHALVFASIATSALSQLSPNYYDYSCPKALSTIKSVVEASVQKERRMGASLLRLHFHDCFVNVRHSTLVGICIHIYTHARVHVYTHVNMITSSYFEWWW